MQRVAILGLGIMGGGMAANWLAKGFEVAVWNRTAVKAQALAGKGAKVAATPREAATQAPTSSSRWWLTTTPRGASGSVGMARLLERSAARSALGSSTLTP